MMTSRLRLLMAVAALALLAIPATASAAEWDPTPVTLPQGSTVGALEAVSCPAADSCTAVGESSGEPDLPDDKPMAVTESGGVWGQGVTIDRPVGATATLLEGVSCPAVGSCVAVGYEQAPSFYYTPKVPVVAVETDGTWSETFPITPPGGATYAILTSVSCSAVGSCVAVGGDESGPFGVAETGGTWGPGVQIQPTAPAGEPVTPDPITFGGVSCPGLGTCVGAGLTWNPAGERRPGAATAAGGAWGEAVQVASPGAATPNFLAAVSCPVVGSCVAVGGNGAELFVVPYTDGAWAVPAPIAIPDGAPLATLDGVTCPAAGSCLAVGSYYPSSEPFKGSPMLAAETGGTWGQAVPLLAPAGAAYAWLNGVSCSAGGACEAVGVSGAGGIGGAQLPVTYAGELRETGSGSTGTSAGSGSASVTVTTVSSPHGGGSAITTCSLSLISTSIKVTRTHVAQVKLRDTGGAACKGTVSLAIKAKERKVRGKPRKPKALKIGSGPVSLSPGATATVPVRLNGAGKSTLTRSRGALKAALTARAGTAQIAKPVHLHAPQTKRSRT